ncbi:MAG TPA: enoyl-CoA hydratase-related protein [Mycobacteriales bacterium]|nr:enoyl-CoA hydratase-related protein [Mycobacteriales bacterium]
MSVPHLETVLVDLDDGVATLTLNRPERRNAFTVEMRTDLGAAYRYCANDANVRAVVLTGARPAFCAGADLESGERTFDSPGAGFSAAGLEVAAWEVPKPVIAAINGHAIGLGLTIALQCDLRLFAAEATYGVVQVRRGVIGDAYSHWVLPRVVGFAAAAEILLTGATFDGRRAVELGIGSRALATEEVLPAAQAIARDIATNVAPRAVALSKRLLWDSFDLDRAAVGWRETQAHLELMGGEDAREGVRAFMERRPPTWSGR